MNICILTTLICSFHILYTVYMTDKHTPLKGKAEIVTGGLQGSFCGNTQCIYKKQTNLVLTIHFKHITCMWNYSPYERYHVAIWLI